jgi:hypothetical protein
MHFRANFTKVHMFRKLSLDATRVYLFMEMATAMCLCLPFIQRANGISTSEAEQQEIVTEPIL